MLLVEIYPMKKNTLQALFNLVYFEEGGIECCFFWILIKKYNFHKII